MARDVISGAGKYDKVLDAMNKDENKNTQIRNATAKEFLSKFTDTPPSDPRLEAFIQKVETSQGK
jgi:hypothetical protein